MNVTIVIPVYNSALLIREVIKAVLNQDYESGALEVILVDDGSTDRTSRIIGDFPVTCIHQENRGPASARNTGWRAAKGEIVCFTDSDCLPSRDWISRMVDAFVQLPKDSKVAVVCGSYEIANQGKLVAQCIHQDILSRHKRMGPFVRAFGSYNVAVSKKVLEEVGGFNDEYRAASGEDNELSYKLLNKGYKILFKKEIRVAHYHTDTLIKYLKEQYKHGVWRMKIYRDFPRFASGDDYTNYFDIIEPPLTVCLTLIFFVLVLSFFSETFVFPGLTMFCLLLLVGDLAGNLKTPWGIYKDTGQMKFFYLFIINTLRGFARGYGMLRGTVRFWL